MWAKSLDDQGQWLPLWQHLDDAADVAGGLFDDWLSVSARAVVAEPFGGDVLAARTAVRFLAGVHDVGKATPAFAVQDGVLAARMCGFGLVMPLAKAGLADRSRVHHSLAGYHLLQRWLLDRGWSRRLVAQWAVIVGGHHGVPPDQVSVGGGRPAEYPALYGHPVWADVQGELIDRVAARCGAGDWLGVWRPARLTAAFQVVVSGLVILADWIASDESLFGFYSETLPEVAEGTGRGAAGLGRLGLPPPWRCGDGPGSAEELFAVRFALPPGAELRPVQREAFEVAGQMPGPGLMIIEAPMGEDKTEAALAAVEVMSRRWGCGGVLVALPTQATTDAMFTRVLEWLDAVGSPGELVGAVTLSHAKAGMSRLFQGLVGAGRLADIGRDEDGPVGGDGCAHAVVAHSWLSGRKKSQLANFVVATIDQLLFAGLKARHLMLRHLALSGKVVVIDEVHAYDAFMNSYLTKVLTWLGAYGVPVVALSATLPADRREVLLSAYRRGRHRGESAEAAGAGLGYPLISWTDGERVRARVVKPSARRVVVSIDALGGGVEDDLDRLVAFLGDALSGGGCALVVRNTVTRVLHTATVLRGVFPGEVTVAHSRFIAADRMARDAELLARFGPPRPGVVRPQRHVVVASQVIEQSLDVDFDVVVSDLAPVDLVLQRMGRLHRHQRQRPLKLQRARLMITGADFGCDPPALERGAADFVYHRYPMLRSAAVLAPRFGAEVHLPEDIATLVGQAYGGERVGPPGWQAEIDEQHDRWRRNIEARVADAGKFQIADPLPAGDAILGWVSGSVGDADDDAQGQGQVRDGQPSLEVILMQQDRRGGWRTPDWLPDGRGGVVVPTDVLPSAAVAAILLQCTVRLPLVLSGQHTEELLRMQSPASWKQSKSLYRLPVITVGDDGCGRVGDRPVRYTPELGLEVMRVDQI